MRRIPLIGILRSLFQPQRETTRIETGSTTSLNAGGAIGTGSIVGRRYDQERIFTPVRDTRRARALARIAALPEVAACIESIIQDAFSSPDGNDLGFKIADTLADETTPVDADVQRICQACIDRTMSDIVMSVVAEEMLESGDSFRAIILDPGNTRVVRLKELPPWEIFRVENDDGIVRYFEQRKWLSDGDGKVIHPAICVHWRFRRNSLYGRALFEEMAPDAESLSKGYDSLDRAVVSTGINPNIHVMPSGTDDDYREQYKRSHEQRVRSGTTMTDYYLLPAQDGSEGTDGKVYKMSDTYSPDVKALLDNVDQRRRRFAMKGHTPLWLLAIDTAGAKDLAGQPALSRAKFINWFRSQVTAGVKHVLNVELALNGIMDAQYRLQWPAIMVNPMEAVMNNNNDAGEPTATNAAAELDYWKRKTAAVNAANGHLHAGWR